MMSIEALYNSNYTIAVYKHSVHGVSIDIKPELLPAFLDLVQRAMNTWADAPPELKEFADLLLDGKVQQDYHSQV